MKELEKKFSIIIPLYNAEETIDRCMNSIVNQNYNNYEVIVADNESTDNSLSIIKKYQKEYGFINIFKSKSSLAGGVKNLAIKKCSGDYFIVVDSDDYVEENLLMTLNKKINKEYSLIRYNAYHNLKNSENMFITNIAENEYNNITYLKLVINEYINENKIFGPSWLYAYNTKFFKDNKFVFKNMHQEDYGLTPQIILKTKNIYVINDILYSYIYNEKGMTNTKSNKMIKAIDVIYHSNNHLKNMKLVDNEIKDIFIKYIYVTLKRKYEKLNDEEKEIFMNNIKGSDYIEKFINFSNNSNI